MTKLFDYFIYDSVGEIMEILTKIVWVIATVMIVGVGIYLTFSLKFIQFNFVEMFRSIKSNDKKTISPFSTLMLTLGGRIGVGSVAGVALALYLGGPGSIFWMWMTAFIAATNTFGETVLGMKYHQKDGNVYRGGAPYYISKGLNKKWLGTFYAILIIISYIGGFIGIQANTITKSLNQIIDINPFIVGIIISVLSLFIIWGGIKKIMAATNKIVPIMLIIYLLCGLYVTIIQIEDIPYIFQNIISSAFNFQSFLGGFLPVFIIGIQRGIFSNEAGIGTGSLASSTSNIKEPVINGYVQMLGIYITTLLVCTATAIMIMSSDYQNLNLSDVNGIELTLNAFYFHLDKLGHLIIMICIILFSFSTILTGYYYGESCLKFILDKPSLGIIKLLKIITCLVLLIGAVISATMLWNLIDFLVALLAIINVYTIYMLKDEIKEEVIAYKRKKC